MQPAYINAWLPVLRVLPTSAVNISGRSICIVLRRSMLRSVTVATDPILGWVHVAQLCLKAPVEFGCNWMCKRRYRWVSCLKKQTQWECFGWREARFEHCFIRQSQTVLSEHKRASTQWRIQLPVGCAWRSVVDGFALLRSSFIEAGQMTATVCRYTMTIGSRTVDLPHLAFLASWVSPGE